ncbi:MAG TPA: hypothetical protein GX707_10025 [Epulopiscium sp.]|nr:hypothetical protein [Candidatus Epulonipiscium sp.]
MAKKDEKKAIALSYDFEDAAPRVVAKGSGLVAQNILDSAQIHDVPVYEDAKLAKMLTQLEIGDNIPPELYEIVAQVLVFITDVDYLQEQVSKGENKQENNR